MQETEQKDMRASSLVFGSASSGKGVEGGKEKEARMPQIYILSPWTDTRSSKSVSEEWS